MSLSRLGAVVTIFASLLVTRPLRAQEACFTRIDNGTDKTGWHPSTTNHHGPGLGWTVEGGALVGRQTAGAKGGILMTDAMYKDVEVVFEVKVDWGCDSGFFFRTTAGDRAYQELIDHLPNGAVGPFYGEGFATELYYRPYYLTDMGATAVKDPTLTPIFDLATWPTIWKPTQFNEIRVRVEGNPPHMQAWISGVKVADYTDPMKRAEINEAGPLAIQVHGGTDRWTATGSVQFRNIRVKDLTQPCAAPADGGAADAGAAGAAGDAREAGAAVDAGGAAGAGSAGTAGAAGAGGAAGNVGSPGAAGTGAGSGGTTGSAGTSGGAGTAGGAGTSGAAGATGTAGTTGAAGTAPAADGGCGCAMAAAPPVSELAWAALFLALAAARRRGRGVGR